MKEGAENVVPREVEVVLKSFIGLLTSASVAQNLVSRGSLEDVWNRHVVDCAQLSPLVVGTCVDLGSGAGLPGIVLAILGHQMVLVEPRRRRVEFLTDAAAALGLGTLRIVHAKAEHLQETFDTITARAVAPLTRMLEIGHHLAHSGSRWVLPKGRSVHSELEIASRAWHGRFELVPSITDPAGMIVVAEDVKPRLRR